MNGPAHYSEGERLLSESEATSAHFNPDRSHALAAQAQAHFTAALVATLATHQHPDSIAWDRVINQ